MQDKEVIAIVSNLELLLSIGELRTPCSQNALTQNSNTGSDSVGISRGGGADVTVDSAGGASSGTGSYNSNGGFALVGSTGAGGGSSVC